MHTMEECLVVSVPAALRAIFSQWADRCDPAHCRAGGGSDPRAAAAIYSLLAGTIHETALARAAVARVYADALRNREFGQFAELRREGEQVFPWIARVVADDPVLCRQLA